MARMSSEISNVRIRSEAREGAVLKSKGVQRESAHPVSPGNKMDARRASSRSAKQRSPQATRRRVFAAAEGLKQALFLSQTCPNTCFKDPATLARCEGCRDDLVRAAESYVQAVEQFRKGIERETVKKRARRKVG